MTAVDLDALEQKARAATPGPWTVSDAAGDLGYAPAGSAQVRADAIRSSGCLVPFGILHHSDAAFIAAANPSTVLALIARVREAEATIDADLTADNGETWESECMRARVQRDAAESRAQRAEGEAKEWEARAELAARLVTDGPYAKDAARLMDLRLRESDLEERATRAEERLAVAVGALREIEDLADGAEAEDFELTDIMCRARAALAEVGDS